MTCIVSSGALNSTHSPLRDPHHPPRYVRSAAILALDGTYEGVPSDRNTPSTVLIKLSPPRCAAVVGNRLVITTGRPPSISSILDASAQPHALRYITATKKKLAAEYFLLAQFSQRSLGISEHNFTHLFRREWDEMRLCYECTHAQFSNSVVRI